MKQDKLADYSLQLAQASMAYAQHLRGYGAKKDQFLRASSAVGANIAEAKYGNGIADFVNKLHIALKECNETKFWLELFTPETEEQAEALKKMKRLNGNIMRMLIQSINTVKARPDWKR
ncbi:MAG: four helix bundle protein [Akkermansia sp.]|nr:four helix bundle protein [Akkermansia sp.]